MGLDVTFEIIEMDARDYDIDCSISDNILDLESKCGNLGVSMSLAQFDELAQYVERYRKIEAEMFGD